VRFTNDTGLVVTNLTVSYTGKQWRQAGNTATQYLTCSYRISNSAITDADAPGNSVWTSVPGLGFASPTVGTNATAWALDGNNPTNRALRSSEIAGAAVAPGQELFLRWLDAKGAGNNHALAIDDLTVSFTTLSTITASASYTISASSWLPGQGLQFVFTNTPGASFSVLAATNAALRLSNWTPVTGLSEVSPGQFQFTDPRRRISASASTASARRRRPVTTCTKRRRRLA